MLASGSSDRPGPNAKAESRFTSPTLLDFDLRFSRSLCRWRSDVLQIHLERAIQCRPGDGSMGIYDRDYYRREGPSYLGSFMERGKVCKWLILINVVCYGLQQFSPALFEAAPVSQQQTEPFTEIMQLDSQAVCNGQVWRLLTHAFMHATVMHIV